MKQKLFILLAAGLFAALPPAFAQEGWPMSVAEKGCRFDWTGTNGYEEVAYSHGAAKFPLILFSREDWGPEVYRFIPFCGDDCLTETGSKKLQELYPLKVGNMVELFSLGRKVNITVERLHHISHLDDLPVFIVRTSITGEEDTVSWWSPDIGWLVGFEVGTHFAKTVVRVECPNGMTLPSSST